jgi:hypothetical protein
MNVTRVTELYIVSPVCEKFGKVVTIIAHTVVTNHPVNFRLTMQEA